MYRNELNSFVQRSRDARQFLKEQAATVLSTYNVSPVHGRRLYQRIDFVFDHLLRLEGRKASLKPILELPGKRKARKRELRLMSTPYRSASRSTARSVSSTSSESTLRRAPRVRSSFRPRKAVVSPQKQSHARSRLSRTINTPQVHSPTRPRLSRDLLRPILSTRKTMKLSLRPPGSAHLAFTKVMTKTQTT